METSIVWIALHLVAEWRIVELHPLPNWEVVSTHTSCTSAAQAAETRESLGFWTPIVAKYLAPLEPGCPNCNSVAKVRFLATLGPEIGAHA